MSSGAKYSIRFSREFTKAFKALAKRHRSLKEDFKEFSEALKENPFQGTELSPGIRKIRKAISSKGKRKSGGARVITFTVLATEEPGIIYMLDIYDKSDYDTADINVLKAWVAAIGKEEL